MLLIVVFCVAVVMFVVSIFTERRIDKHNSSYSRYIYRLKLSTYGKIRKELSMWMIVVILIYWVVSYIFGG